MTQLEYRAELRLNRGRLTKMNTQMDDIYKNATKEFAYMMIKNKAIGLDNACDIVDKLTHVEQNTLVGFIGTKVPKANAHDIELKVLRIINDR